MKFQDAKQLHSGDDVTVVETGQVLRVLSTYVLVGSKAVLIECEDGETYHHTEIC